MLANKTINEVLGLIQYVLKTHNNNASRKKIGLHQICARVDHTSGIFKINCCHKDI